MDSVGYLVHLSDTDEDSEDEVTPISIQRKRLRTESNPFDMTNKRFMKLFRITKDCFKIILRQTEGYFIERKNIDAIPPILKLAATIRFLAEGSYQQAVGQDFLIGMAQPTVSVVIAETLNILESEMCKHYINFKLSEEEKEKSKQIFFNKTGFPGVIGCVDGTHINIIRPDKNEHHFFNRKGTHSLNVMMTCDYNMKITSVNPRYGGCSHDSAVWNMSRNVSVLKQAYLSGDKSSWILGDSGYSLQPWCMTPYRNALEGSRESRYNTLHSRARSIIERVFGVLKGRWRCILHTRELHYQPEKAAQIVNVCCLLHNLCIKYNVPIDEHLLETEEHVERSAIDELDSENFPNEAKRIRNEIRDRL